VNKEKEVAIVTVDKRQVTAVVVDKTYTGSIILEIHLNQGNILRTFMTNRREIKIKKN